MRTGWRDSNAGLRLRDQLMIERMLQTVILMFAMPHRDARRHDRPVEDA